MQTSTHGLTIGATEVRKEFVAEHAPGLAPRPLATEQTLALGAALRRLYGVPVEATGRQAWVHGATPPPSTRG